MSGTRVQPSGKQTLSNIGTATTFHMPGNWTAGNTGAFLDAYFDNGTGTMSAVSMGGTAATKSVGSGSHSQGNLEVWEAKNVAGGVDTVVVTPGGSGQFHSAAAIEFSGLLSSGATDSGSGPATATGTSASPSVTSNTLAQADSTVFALVTQLSGNNVSITAPGGWTEEFNEPDGVNQEAGEGAWKNVNATTAVTATWTLGSSNAWVAIIVAFKAAAGGGGVATVHPGSQSPEPVRRRAARVDAWSPLPAIAAAAALTAWGFSDPATPRKPAPAREQNGTVLPNLPLRVWGFSETQDAPKRTNLPVDAWAPLPAVAAPSAAVGWGFSPGQSTQLLAQRPDDWAVLPALAAPPASTSVDCQAPLPRRIARVLPEGWQPLASLLGAIVEPQPVTPARLKRATVQDWQPNPSLALPSPTLVDCQAPDPRRLARALPDSWTPLGQISAPVVPTLVEPQGPTNRQNPRANVADWQPLPRITSLAGVPATGFEALSPASPARGRVPVDNWEPLPSLQTAAPSSFGYECLAPVNPRGKALQPDSWEPLPALIPLPVVPSGFECSVFLPRKVRSPVVDAWQPLGSIAVAASNTPSVDCQAPDPRKVRAVQPDAWEPLASLPSTWSFSGSYQMVLDRPAVAGWEPLGPLAAATTSAVDPGCQAPDPRRLARAVADSWEPLSAIVTAAPLAISVECQPPLARARRAPVVDAWEPLPAVAFTAPPAIALDFQQAPPVARRAPIADNWTPLASLLGAVALAFQATPLRAQRSPLVESWDPLPGLPVALLSVAFSGETQRAKLSLARVGDWDPLPASIPPPPVLPWVDFESPIPRFTLSRLAQGDGGASSGWIGGVVIANPFYPLPTDAAGRQRVAVVPMTRRQRVAKVPRRRS